jgi:hypothetical protein
VAAIDDCVRDNISLEGGRVRRPSCHVVLQTFLVGAPCGNPPVTLVDPCSKYFHVGKEVGQILTGVDADVGRRLQERSGGAKIARSPD